MVDIAAVADLQGKISEMRAAQQIFATYSQEQVDKIFYAVAMAAMQNRIPLAKLAVEETGMGVLEDKILKNSYAAESVYHQYRDRKTCGVIEEDASAGIRKIAEPIGVIGAMVPVTNPTSSVIFQVLLCVKTRNAILISPHPGAKKCTCAAVKLCAQAACEAGAPEQVIDCVEHPTPDLSHALMAEADLILATGGAALVRAAHSAGKPAIAVGPGNCPVILHESADARKAVSAIIHSKTFDGGLLCTSEQAVIAVGKEMEQKIREEFRCQGGYFLSAGETEAVRTLLREAKNPNGPQINGQNAVKLAQLAGFQVPDGTKVLLGEVISTGPEEPFAQEKLCPILAMYRVPTFRMALELAVELVQQGGSGHTAGLHIDPSEKEDLEKWSAKLKTCRLIVNSPTSLGGIGGIYNTALPPSLTLGCGTWGGGILSENLGPQHLLNIKTMAERRKHPLRLRLPHTVYFERGCTATALGELKETYHCKRVFLITDHFLYQKGAVAPVLQQLEQMDLAYATYYDIHSTPTLQSVQKGLAAMEQFQPDAVIGMGGGSALDAAKLMRYAYEHPEGNFTALATPFWNRLQRIFDSPKREKKTVFFAIPTTGGTGSENTPFAILSDGDSNLRWPITDAALLPTVSVIDADHMMQLPKGLTRDTGISVLARALESYVALGASDYTDGFALLACRTVFRYLPLAYDGLEREEEAREKMANAAALAGMAAGNTAPGLIHAMACALTAWHHLPHGVACALVMPEVIRYHAQATPRKMGTFSQYPIPCAGQRYGEMADFCGFGGGKGEKAWEPLWQKVVELREKVEIYNCIHAYGIEEAYFLDTLDAMTEAAWNSPWIASNPVYPLMEEIRAIYLRCYYGDQ